MKPSKLLSFVFASSLIFSTACGGGSSSSSGSTDGGATTADLRSLSTVPDFDIDALDVAAASDASVSPSLARTIGEVGSFSYAGCEMRMQLEEVKAQVTQQQFDKCIIETLETTQGLTVPENTYGFYSMDFSDLEDEEEGPSGMNIRVKIGLNNDQLELFVCESADGDTYTQTNYTRYAVTDDGRFDVFSKGIHDEQDFGTFGQQIQSYLPDKDIADFEVGDEASVTGSFNGPWGGGSISVSALNDGTLKNIVGSAFQSGGDDSEWGTWTTQAYGETNADEGCAKFSSTGSYPGMLAGQLLFEDDLDASGFDGEDPICWVEFSEDTDFESLTWPTDFIEAADEDGNCNFSNSGTECFSYSTDDSENLISLIAASDDVEYFDGVDATELDEYAAPTIAFEGDEVWDCESESEFTDLVADVEDATALMAAVSENCAEPDFDRTNVPCFDQGSEQQVEDGGHELMGEFDQIHSDYTKECSDVSECGAIADLDGAGCTSRGGDAMYCNSLCATVDDCTAYGPGVDCVAIEEMDISVCGYTCATDDDCGSYENAPRCDESLHMCIQPLEG
ncbi:hypothetical protein K1X76_06330 [bacterium]|nr:hypothetical protein [bacterium]